MRPVVFVPAYRRRKSRLHNARAAVAIVYLGAVSAAAFVFSQPLVLAALMAALLLVAVLTGSYLDLKPFLVMALVVGLLIAAFNTIVSGQGLTVLLRGPGLPVFGNIDITLEGCVYGLLMGLRVAVVMVAAGLYTVAVDPDRVLRLFRRLGFRSALTVSVATRLVPTLGRDAQRLSEAYRCRPDFSDGGGRVAVIRRKAPVLRALLAGSLERAADVAMALEVRGFGRARPGSNVADRWSFNDVVFALSGGFLLLTAAAGALAGLGEIQVYPRLSGGAVSAGTLALALTLLLLILLPVVVGRGHGIETTGRRF